MILLYPGELQRIAFVILIDTIAFMRILLKSIAAFLLLSLYALISLGIMALPARRARRLARLTGNSSFFARLGLRVLGIRVSSRREKRKGIRKRRTNYLIIANHLTYVDILVVASLMPSVFITSVELKQTFPLGLFAWLGGCLFVERRSPAGLKREIEEIASGARRRDLGRVVPGRHDLERRHGAALQELAHYRGHHDRHQSPPGLHPLPGGQWIPGGPRRTAIRFITTAGRRSSSTCRGCWRSGPSTWNAWS